jgi:hypothetical protein
MEIVGLKQKVQDDINKIIFKFVGVKMHPWAEKLKKEIEYHLRGVRNPEYTVTDAIGSILGYKQAGLGHRVFESYDGLKKMRSDKARREEFIKLQRWLKVALLRNNFYLNRLFGESKVNQAFLNKQKSDMSLI